MQIYKLFFTTTAVGHKFTTAVGHIFTTAVGIGHSLTA